MTTEDDLDRVRALGARFMSGPYFGRATREPTPVPPPAEDGLADHHSRNLPALGTPYSIAQGLRREPLVMNRELLIAQIAALEERALASGAATIALGVFGEETTFSQATYDRYERIRDTVGLTAMFSGGFTTPPVPGVRGESSTPPTRCATSTESSSSVPTGRGSSPLRSATIPAATGRRSTTSTSRPNATRASTPRGACSRGSHRPPRRAEATPRPTTWEWEAGDLRCYSGLGSPP